MKRFILCLLALLLILCTCLSASVESMSISSTNLFDYEGLLTYEEQNALIDRLEQVSEAYQCDVIIVTDSDLQGKTPTQYADDFYDYNGFGYNDTRDGIFLFVSLSERKWATSTTGKAIDIFTDSDLYYIEDEFKPYLSAGDYNTAFNTFVDLCEEELSTYGKFQFSFFYVFVGLIIGVIVAFISVLIMKGQLKSVRFQSAAHNYMRNNSLNITERKDIFLYSTVSRRAKPKDNGGSSTHTSSSGSSHGGHSGSF